MMKKRYGIRKGQVLVLSAMMVIAMLGFCALSIDTMVIFLARAQLQHAVDAASLAAANELIGHVDDAAKDRSAALAVQFAALNTILNEPLHLDSSDVRFGLFDPTTKQFVPEEAMSEGQVIDSIWVRGRRQTGSIDGPISLFFSRIFGINQAQVMASAVATQPRRFVMLAMDRSGSMCYDTVGISRKYTTAWTGSGFLERLDTSSVYAYGPDYNNRLERFRKDVPGDVASYGGWVWMPYYMLVNETRSITRQGSTPTNVTGWWRHIAYFFARDRTSGAIRYDFVPEHIRNQVAAERPQVRDYYINTYGQRRWQWSDFAAWTVWNASDPNIRNFRYAYKDAPGDIMSGWMRIPASADVYGGYSNVSDAQRGHYFWADIYGPVTSRCGYGVATQPVQPIQDSQDAAVEFISLMDHVRDKCGIVSYAERASTDYILTDDWTALTDAAQRYDPRGATNTPEAMKYANDELIDSPRVFGQKQRTQRIMICTTDGNANTVTNVYGTGTTYYQDQWYFDVTFNSKVIRCRIHPTVARQLEIEALRARSNGVRIYTVSFGDSADIYLAPEIAAMTNGAFYYAENSEDLVEVFTEIFRRLPPLISQ